MSKFHPLRVAASSARRATPSPSRSPCRGAARAVPLSRRASTSRCARRSTAQDLRRSYSICSAVQDDALRIAVKRNPGGVFSTWANETLKAGDTLDVMPPLGPLQRAARSRARAGTTSASPRAAASRRCCRSSRRRSRPSRTSRFTLFYGNRASGTVMFKEELAALKDTLPRPLQPRPRAVARGAGHRAPARPHRPREGRRAARALGASSTTSTPRSSAAPKA